MKIKVNRNNTENLPKNEMDTQFEFLNGKYLVTQGINDFPYNCPKGLVVELFPSNLMSALDYFFRKASLEIKHFQSEDSYKNIATEKHDMLFYTCRILPST